MQFLKTLFWVALAVGIVLFASINWHAVTVNLWGGLQADIKLPVLVLGAFLLGFLPMLLFHRARMWSAKRRIEGMERQAAHVQTHVPAPGSPAPAAAPSGPEPIVVDNRTAPSA
jgi:uncharacterized integral membrane protein